MLQALKEYFSELSLKNLFEKQTGMGEPTDNKEHGSVTVEEKIAILRDELAKTLHTVRLLSSQRKYTVIQATELREDIDDHITLLEELLEDGQDDIQVQCKKVLHVIYTDIMLNEAGTELYKFITAQVGLYPHTADHTLHFSEKKITLIYDMAFVAISDGTFEHMGKHIEERIKSLEELKSVVNDLRTVCKKEPLNRMVIDPLKEIKEKYWASLHVKQSFTDEDELLMNRALKQLSEVERELQLILHRRKDVLKQNAANDAWEHVTGQDRLLQSLQYCAALKWYEHKEELTGQQFKYDVAFAVAVREKAKEIRVFSEQASHLLDEADFGLHKSASHVGDIPVYWGKEVLFGGELVAENHTLIDSEANRQFLTTTKDINTESHPLIDGEANVEFLEIHYAINRHKDDSLISSEEYEEYLKFKAAQRRTSPSRYVFDE